MKVYFISGLAADSRVFKHIRLPGGYEIVHLEWITAFKNETLASYAKRLAGKINKQEPFVLIGLSMGGMIACEIANQYRAIYGKSHGITILLSSVPVARHLPVHFTLAAALGLHKIIPVRFLKSASMLNRFFSTDNKEDKNILRQVVQESDPAFIRWAMQAILQWKNAVIPNPFFHIHGTSDRILPVRFTKPTHVIKKGSHLMIMGRAAEINILLREILEQS